MSELLVDPDPFEKKTYQFIVKLDHFPKVRGEKSIISQISEGHACFVFQT